MKQKQDQAATTTLSCSFCGKSQHEVQKLIVGPKVFICDECIALCNDIIAGEIDTEPSKETKNDMPAPPQPPDRDRLLSVANALRDAANEMRRAWVTTRQDAGLVHEMADRFDALGEAVREELAR